MMFEELLCLSVLELTCAWVTFRPDASGVTGLCFSYSQQHARKAKCSGTVMRCQASRVLTVELKQDKASAKSVCAYR